MVDSGILNGTFATYYQTADYGYFAYTSLYNHTLTFTINDGLQVRANEAVVYSGDTLSFTSEPVIISRSRYILPFVPYMFIVGMTGLGCMFLSPLYGIYLWRKDDKEKGLVQFLAIGALGFGLFIAWLWH